MTDSKKAATHLRHAAARAAESTEPYFQSLGTLLWRLDAHQIGGKSYDRLLLDLLTEHLAQFPNGYKGKE